MIAQERRLLRPGEKWAGAPRAFNQAAKKSGQLLALLLLVDIAQTLASAQCKKFKLFQVMCMYSLLSRMHVTVWRTKVSVLLV
jgi:hypothetical protein